MGEKQMEQMIEEMADFTAETLSAEQEKKQRVKLCDTLKKFNSMLGSRNFTRKCKDKAKQYGVNEKFIKNAYAMKILNAIGESTGTVLETVGEAFNYLIRLIGYAIQKVMDITVSALTKLVNIVTFRKEVTA